MNYWKAIALCSITALVGVVGANVHGVATAEAAGPCHDQPNMAAAKEHLIKAKEFLDKAEHNKGGWREAAKTATGTAITETNRGCEWADDHK
jgi:hypothetical protein